MTVLSIVDQPTSYIVAAKVGSLWVLILFEEALTHSFMSESRKEPGTESCWYPAPPLSFLSLKAMDVQSCRVFQTIRRERACHGASTPPSSFMHCG